MLLNENVRVKNGYRFIEKKIGVIKCFDVYKIVLTDVFVTSENCGYCDLWLNGNKYYFEVVDNKIKLWHKMTKEQFAANIKEGYILEAFGL